MNFPILSKVFNNNEKFFLYSIIIFMTLTTSHFVYNRIINVNEHDTQDRLEHQNVTLAGNNHYPFQYRILQPYSTKLVQIIISPVVKSESRQHLIASEIIMFIFLLGIFIVFSSFLRLFYSTAVSVIGLLFLQVIIIISFNRINQDIETYNLFFFLTGFFLMFKKKENYLPLVFLIASFNYEQIIFLNVFYAAFLLAEKRLFTKKGILMLLTNTAVFLGVNLAMRLYFGFKSDIENYHALDYVISYNLNRLPLIFRVWFEEFLIPIILCFYVYKRSIPFFKYGFICLGLYLILYFTHGGLDEPAKFFPSFLIFIPMSLQILNGKLKTEYTGSEKQL